jgi:hypothetical protein
MPFNRFAQRTRDMVHTPRDARPCALGEVTPQPTRHAARRVAVVGLVALAGVAGCGTGTDGGFSPGGGSGDGTGQAPNSGNGFGDTDGGTPKPGPGNSCATGSADAQRSPVYMLFILDASSSMLQDRKWPAATEALRAIVNDFSVKADPNVAVGLTIFQDEKDPSLTSLNYAGAIQVPLAVVDGAQRDRLNTRLQTKWKGDQTPTRRVVEGQFPLLAGFQPVAPLPAGGKRVVVLITDGVPTPSSDVGPVETYVRQRAQGSPAPAITTFAIGVGDPRAERINYDVGFMGRLAVAGGAPKASCDPAEPTNEARMCHFQITPGGKTTEQIRDEFVASIDTIRGAVASCEYLLTNVGEGKADPNKVNVEFTDGTGAPTEVLQDPANGWTYDDPQNPSRVVFHGAACDAVRRSANPKVSIVLGCETKRPK